MSITRALSGYNVTRPEDHMTPQAVAAIVVAAVCIFLMLLMVFLIDPCINTVIQRIRLRRRQEENIERKHDSHHYRNCHSPVLALQHTRHCCRFCDTRSTSEASQTQIPTPVQHASRPHGSPRKNRQRYCYITSTLFSSILQHRATTRFFKSNSNSFKRDLQEIYTS